MKWVKKMQCCISMLHYYVVVYEGGDCLAVESLLHVFSGDGLALASSSERSRLATEFAEVGRGDGGKSCLGVSRDTELFGTEVANKSLASTGLSNGSATGLFLISSGSGGGSRDDAGSSAAVLELSDKNVLSDGLLLAHGVLASLAEGGEHRFSGLRGRIDGTLSETNSAVAPKFACNGCFVEFYYHDV